ncbi:MAG: aminoacyl-tRNA hydrolase [Planctomycetota bacterium]|jgi:PTH1 family peptidyl-tRNA hydrolase
MHVVLGVGNPGPEYEETRHNLGFRVVDTLAAVARRKLGRFKGLEAEGIGVWIHREPVLLVKPLTYVNRCGSVLHAIRTRERVPLGKLLVVVDDLNLPLGRLRLRPGGSDGGHKGLRSLIAHLETPQFPRLRVGIGDPGARPAEQYVLEPFAPAERPAADRAVRAAAAAVVLWVREGTARAMDRINRRDLDPPRDRP